MSYYSAIRKNKIAICSNIDREYHTKLSVRQRMSNILYVDSKNHINHLYLESKNSTNVLIYKIETGSQM